MLAVSDQLSDEELPLAIEYLRNLIPKTIANPKLDSPENNAVFEDQAETT